MDIVDVILRRVESEIKISRYPDRSSSEDARMIGEASFLWVISNPPTIKGVINIVTDETLQTYRYTHRLICPLGTIIFKWP